MASLEPNQERQPQQQVRDDHGYPAAVVAAKGQGQRKAS